MGEESEGVDFTHYGWNSKKNPYLNNLSLMSSINWKSYLNTETCYWFQLLNGTLSNFSFLSNVSEIRERFIVFSIKAKFHDRHVVHVANIKVCFDLICRSGRTISGRNLRIHLQIEFGWIEEIMNLSAWFLDKNYKFRQ